MRHEILPPGRRASVPHWHTDLDELCYVLSGRVIVQVGETTAELGADEYVIFPAQSGIPHQVRNATDAPATLLLVASAGHADTVVIAD